MIAKSFEQSQSSGGHDVSRVLRLLERDHDMRLRAKIVDFLRPGPLQQPAQGSAVGQIAMVQEKARGRIVGVLVNIVDFAPWLNVLDRRIMPWTS